MSKPRKPNQATEQVKFVLRLPASLHKKIKAQAKTNELSMNEELVQAVKDRAGLPTVRKSLADIAARV